MKRCGQHPAEPVRATVAMPTYRRLDTALAALDSVLAQQTAVAYEVLVLDNAVDPELERAVAQRRQHSRVPLRYIPVPVVGLHNGRHTAADCAAGELLFYIDDDIIADPHWLDGLAEAFSDPAVQLATGPVLPDYEVQPPAWLDGFWHHPGPGQRWCGQLSLLDLGDEPQQIDARLVFGANFAIRRETLFELGGFHPDSLPWSQRRYRGDGETAVSDAASERGMRAVYHPAAKVRHRVPAERLTHDYFERRAFLQGISDSFSDWRRGVDAHAVDQAPQGLIRGLRQRWRRVRRGLRDNRIDPTLGPLRQRMQSSQREGYRYHRQMIADDPGVRQWVERENYWHASLPLVDEGADRGTPSR